jgi:hypothetical protein
MLKLRLSKEEFCLFNHESKLYFLAKDGRLIRVSPINEKVMVSIYSIYEYHIKVTQELPSYHVLEILPIHNVEEFIRYLDLKSLN